MGRAGSGCNAADILRTAALPGPTGPSDPDWSAANAK